MTMNIGINLLETNGTATPSIQGAATSVAGFIVRSARGLPGVVRTLTQFSDFTYYFGDYTSDAYGAYCIRGFFDNGGALAYATRVVDTTTAKAATAPFNDASNPAKQFIVTAGFRGTADVGNWGMKIGIVITTNIATSTFNLIVMLQKSGSTNFTTVETWSNLKVGGAGAQDPNTINDPVSGSAYIVVDARQVSSNPVATATNNNQSIPQPLQNGTPDNLGSSVNPSGALDIAVGTVIANGVFDGVPIQLLACPETSTPSVVGAAIAYCAQRGDCMFVGHAPSAFPSSPGADANAAVTNATQYTQQNSVLQGDNVYGAIYFPYIQVVDPIGNLKWIPPTGHILGVYARMALERGIWKAPAGNAANLNNALDVGFSIGDVAHTNLVKSAGVNAVRRIPGEGIVIDSARTLSANPLWIYVNVRLLFNYVKSSLKQGLTWTKYEPNDTTLWNKANYNSITPFLMGLYRRGAFGPGKPSEVFTVKIDAENNPPANIQQGIFTADVYFYPSRPAETIIITVGQQDSGATASESGR
jgi:phage tail sheath protein FI